MKMNTNCVKTSHILPLSYGYETRGGRVNTCPCVHDCFFSLVRLKTKRSRKVNKKVREREKEIRH